jgi:hypothetical protein
LRYSFEEEMRNLEQQVNEPSEPAPKYGHDYSEPASEEPGPRP